MGIWQTLTQSFRERMLLWHHTPIAWDGMVFGNQFTIPANAPWIRPTLVEFSREKGSMTGKGLSVVEGIFDVQMFFPEGFSESDRLCDSLSGLFRDYTAGPLNFIEPYRSFVGVQEQGWFQVNLSLPFIGLFRTVPGPSEEVLLMIFTQVSHGFSVGDFIHRESTAWSKSLASSTGTIARAIVSGVNGDQFSAVSGGFVAVPSHGFPIGSPLWLSTGSLGSASTSLPSGVVQEVGSVTDANTFLVNFKMHST